MFRSAWICCTLIYKNLTRKKSNEIENQIEIIEENVPLDISKTPNR
jgi:hypothetical protein